MKLAVKKLVAIATILSLAIIIHICILGIKDTSSSPEASLAREHELGEEVVEEKESLARLRRNDVVESKNLLRDAKKKRDAAILKHLDETEDIWFRMDEEQQAALKEMVGREGIVFVLDFHTSF